MISGFLILNLPQLETLMSEYSPRMKVEYVDCLGNSYSRVTFNEDECVKIMQRVLAHGQRHKMKVWELKFRVIKFEQHSQSITFPVKPGDIYSKMDPVILTSISYYN